MDDEKRIEYKKAIWEGYMDQPEVCGNPNCEKKLNKRKDYIIAIIIYDEGDIEEELFFCSNQCFWSHSGALGWIPVFFEEAGVGPTAEKSKSKSKNKGG